MKIDNLIDWLYALAYQRGDEVITLDGEEQTVHDIALDAASWLETIEEDYDD